MNLNVYEIFTSFQGEGISIGTPAIFVRLAGCNLDCEYCDTKYAYEGGRSMSSEDVVSAVVEKARMMVSRPIVVITGGEPLLQMKELEQLIFRLIRYGYGIEIETNGTILPSFEGVQFNVSPKLSNSRVKAYRRIQPNVITYFLAQAGCIFKFVVRDVYDVIEVEEFREKFGIPSERVIVQPEGTTAEATVATLRSICEEAMKHGFRMIPRLHTLIHDGRRGV